LYFKAQLNFIAALGLEGGSLAATGTIV
jgi:hypothetical protein